MMKLLQKLGACSEALDWAEDLEFDEAWFGCERGDWLLWVCAQLNVDRRYVVAAACACAQGVLHLVPAGEERPRVAVETAIRWTQGKATSEEVRAVHAAAHAASSATYAAAAHAASSATYAAAAACAAAAAATNVATTGDAADAAAAAYAAADYASYAVDAPRVKVLKQAAGRVRKVIPFFMVMAAVESTQNSQKK